MTQVSTLPHHFFCFLTLKLASQLKILLLLLPFLGFIWLLMSKTLVIWCWFPVTSSELLVRIIKISTGLIGVLESLELIGNYRLRRSVYLRHGNSCADTCFRRPWVYGGSAQIFLALDCRWKSSHVILRACRASTKLSSQLEFVQRGELISSGWASCAAHHIGVVIFSVCRLLNSDLEISPSVTSNYQSCRLSKIFEILDDKLLAASFTLHDLNIMPLWVVLLIEAIIKIH